MLVGAVIGLISAIIGGWVNHLFALRADRIKRSRDRDEKEAAELRGRLMPSSEKLGKILDEIEDSSRNMKNFLRPQLSKEEKEIKEFLYPVINALAEINKVFSSAIYARGYLLSYMESFLKKHERDSTKNDSH